MEFPRYDSFHKKQTPIYPPNTMIYPCLIAGTHKNGTPNFEKPHMHLQHLSPQARIFKTEPFSSDPLYTLPNISLEPLNPKAKTPQPRYMPFLQGTAFFEGRPFGFHASLGECKPRVYRLTEGRKSHKAPLYIHSCRYRSDKSVCSPALGFRAGFVGGYLVQP